MTFFDSGSGGPQAEGRGKICFGEADERPQSGSGTEVTATAFLSGCGSRLKTGFLAVRVKWNVTTCRPTAISRPALQLENSPCIKPQSLTMK